MEFKLSWKRLEDFQLQNKVVLVRADINVPMDKNEKITDATRIERLRPTFEYLLQQEAKPVILAHFGRPKGQVVESLSLSKVASEMSNYLNANVKFCNESFGDTAKAAISTLQSQEILVLENTRFQKGEEKNDIQLAQKWADLADIYCNDAFSAAHRAHASTEAIARLLPSCVGKLMEAELTALESALGTPKKPVMAIVGGAKISTKIDLISNLIEKTDYLVIGGGMANTFLAAKGVEIGKSLCEHDLLDLARKIMTQAESQSCKLYIPQDYVVAREFKANADSHVVEGQNCPSDAMILDAGPKSIIDIQNMMESANTLVWNGPLGAFEIPPFDNATNKCAQYAAQITQKGQILSIAGGGDTVSALNASYSAQDFTYISTAGGAFLEWMEGKTLPGVAALL